MKFFKEIQQPDAYQRDEINAKSGFGKDSYAYQMDGGANDEDHEGDARREQQAQSGTWYIRLNGKLIKDKAGIPYSFHGKAAANKAALTMQAKLFNKDKEFMLTTNPNDKSQGVAEAGPASMYYSEELAQKVFDLNPNLDASGKADAVLDAGWPIAVKDLGAKSANAKFAYDEDFPSDFVSMYAQLQKQGVAEGESNREMWDRVRSKGTVPGIDREKYTERPGLEGPFSTKSGKVVYYDKAEGKYYDPGTDFYISHDDYQAMNEQGVANGNLKEFAPAGSNDGNDGFNDDTLKRLAAQWYNGDEDPKVEQTLMAAGWEIGQDEGYDDTPGVFVVQAGDINGNSYMSWSAEELEGVAEASLASMRDYFSQADNNTVAVDTKYGSPERKQPANVPPEIQTLINKMYRVGKITPQEFEILKRFQAKTGMNVGLKEADMTTGNQGYDSMLAVMKAVDAGHDATFNLGGEPITLDYNEARFLSGKYKAFLKAGRQEEFLKYMENPMAFDRLMKQLRDLMDKQKNFRGSVQGERGIEESHDDSPVAAALTRKIMSQRLDLLKKYGPVKVTQAIDSAADFFGDVEEIGSSDMYAYMQYVEKELGSMDNNLPAVNENEYWCQLDRTAKLIPEGYKKLSSGYITRTQG